MCAQRALGTQVARLQAARLQAAASKQPLATLSPSDRALSRLVANLSRPGVPPSGDELFLLLPPLSICSSDGSSTPSSSPFANLACRCISSSCSSSSKSILTSAASIACCTLM